MDLVQRVTNQEGKVNVVFGQKQQQDIQKYKDRNKFKPVQYEEQTQGKRENKQIKVQQKQLLKNIYETKTDSENLLIQKQQRQKPELLNNVSYQGKQKQSQQFNKINIIKRNNSQRLRLSQSKKSIKIPPFSVSDLQWITQKISENDHKNQNNVNIQKHQKDQKGEGENNNLEREEKYEAKEENVQMIDLISAELQPVNSSNFYLSKENKSKSKLNEKTVSFADDVECSENMIKKLKMKGYTIADPSSQEYDLLIIRDDLKLGKKLLLAILTGKKVKNKSWIFNDIDNISGKLEGHPWSRIQQSFGKAGKVFGCCPNQRYYLSPRLRMQYSALLIVGGATLVSQLSKGLKSSQYIILILSEQDQDIYFKWNKMTKWKVVHYTMIFESILLGEEIIQKYRMDETSFKK